jgi:hypothetical protein
MDSVWGSGFFEQLSKELKDEFPDMQGFSQRNIYYMKQFYLFYSQEDTILHQVGAKLENGDLRQLSAELENHPIFQIPWRHHVEIINKCKSIKEALFYIQKTIKNGWSRAMLMNFIETDLYQSQGKSINNFDRRERNIDLLFYHLELRCYVVIELKTKEFEPEHTGKFQIVTTVY